MTTKETSVQGVNNSNTSAENQTVNTINFANLSSTEKSALVNEVLQKYISVSQVKKAKEAVIKDFELSGAASYLSLLASVKIAAKEAISKDYQETRANIFNYENILSIAWQSLSKDKAFSALCNRAQMQSISLSNFVLSYYSYVTKEGAILVKRAYVSGDSKYLLYYFSERVLTDTAALSVLKVSLTNFANSLKRKISKDDFFRINTFEAGTLADVFVLDAETHERGARVSNSVTLAKYASLPDNAILFTDYKNSLQ